MNKNVLNIQIKTDAFKRFKETLPWNRSYPLQVEHGLLCPDLMSRMELCECLAWSYANISHRAMRTSRMELCECLAWSDANISHGVMRTSRMERCEYLAWSDANISHRAMRTSRIERCERLAWSDTKPSYGVMRTSRMERYEHLVQRFGGRTAKWDLKIHNRLSVWFVRRV